MTFLFQRGDFQVLTLGFWGSIIWGDMKSSHILFFFLKVLVMRIWYCLGPSTVNMFTAQRCEQREPNHYNISLY